MTQYISVDKFNILHKKLKDNLSGLSDKVAKVEKDNGEGNTNIKTSVESNTKAIEILNGDSTVEGSVKKAIKDVIGTAPEALDTLGEIATQLQNDENAASALTNEIATKANTADVYSKTESDAKYQLKGNYLTEHQSLDDYAKKTDISTDFYNKTEVDAKIANVSGTNVPRLVIFDTDWMDDVDDAVALRVLLYAEKCGMIDLYGCCIDAVNSTSSQSLSLYLRILLLQWIH